MTHFTKNYDKIAKKNNIPIQTEDIFKFIILIILINLFNCEKDHLMSFHSLVAGTLSNQAKFAFPRAPFRCHCHLAPLFN